jgi:hypothetical protein
MTMTDGNPSEQKEVRATIDAHEVARAYNELRKAEEKPAAPKSFFKEKINSILQDKNVDADNLNTIADLIEKHGEDLKQEFQKTANVAGGQSMQGRYQEAVSDALEKYTEGDDDLEGASEYLHSKIMSKLAKDPSIVQKFNSGVLDKQSIKAIAKAEVEAHSKNVLKRDKSSKGVTMASNVPGSQGHKAIESSESAGNISDIKEEPRRIAAQKFHSLLKRTGKYNAVEANNKALAMGVREFKRSGSQA